QSADPLYRAHISKMTKIGDRGVLCLLSDSTESEKEGYTPSEITVAKELDDVFKRAKSRIIFACYASQINAIQRLINAAYKSERKVAIVGRALHHIFQMTAKNGYLYVPENLIIVPNNLGEYPDNKVVVLMSGNQGEPLEALQMMVKRSYNQIQIQKGDTVIIAASPHRGGEQFLIRTVDMLYRAGANVISGKRVHVSGHGRREELKLMINLMKPKFFVPIHGEYKMLVSHAQIAEHMGIPSENIFIPE